MGPRILVKRVTAAKPSSQIIDVVELEPEPSQEGIVRYTGELKTQKGIKVDMDVKPGDHILLKKYSGTPVTINDEELYFIDYADALAVLEK